MEFCTEHPDELTKVAAVQKKVRAYQEDSQDTEPLLHACFSVGFNCSCQVYEFASWQ